MRCLSFEHFGKNEKVSTCSVILNLAENEVSVLCIFLLWFRHARGSRGSPFSFLISFLSAPDVSLHEVRLFLCFISLRGDADLMVEDFLGN